MLEAGDAEVRHLREREVLGQQHRRVGRRGLVARQRRAQVAERRAERAGGKAQAGVDTRRAAAVEQQVVARNVLDQEPALAVVDQSARRLDRAACAAVVLGLLGVVAAAHDLHEPEERRHHDERHHGAARQQAHAPDQVFPVFADAHRCSLADRG
jgi:hypothetical protein